MNNYEIVIEAITQDGNSLQYCPKDIQNNKDIILKAVEQCGLSLA